jgi:carbamoyl-phosphate synthase large subunit
MKIVVTGVGAVIGQGIVESLRRCPEDVTVIGVDRNADAFGGRRCDEFVAKPADENSVEYSSFWKQLVLSRGVDLVIPGIEQDVFFFDRHRDDNLPVVLNTPELVSLGRDKWMLHERLVAANIAAIPSSIDGSWDDCVAELGPAPLLMKPRRGSGGQGQVNLDSVTDFDYWRQKTGDNFMVQRIMGSDDREYTVSVFGLGDGSATRPAIMRRTLGPGGATWYAETVASHDAIETVTAALNGELQPLGPTNYQFRIQDGVAYLLEVNPRISASTSLRARLGVNEAWMCIEHFVLQREIGSAALSAGRGWRYIDDEVEVQ